MSEAAASLPGKSGETPHRLVQGAKLVAVEFAPLLAFYCAYYSLGVKAAILTALVVALASYLAKVTCSRPITGFFRFSIFLTLLLGGVDLYLEQSFLYRYEGVLVNALTGAWFGLTLFRGKPIIQEFAEQELAGEELDDDRKAYTRILTQIWTATFFAKAAVYFVTAYSGSSFEELLIFRLLVGKLSFVVLIFGERIVRVPAFRAVQRWRGRGRLLALGAR